MIESIKEPACKSDISQLWLEQAQKHLSLTDMLWLFSSECTKAFYRFRNGQVTFQCA